MVRRPSDAECRTRPPDWLRAPTCLVSNAGTDEGDQVRCVDGSPADLRGVDELVGHGNTGRHRRPDRNGGRLKPLLHNRIDDSVGSPRDVHTLVDEGTFL
jgi:hypothetical protein